MTRTLGLIWFDFDMYGIDMVLRILKGLGFLGLDWARFKLGISIWSVPPPIGPKNYF